VRTGVTNKKDQEIYMVHRSIHRRKLVVRVHGKSMGRNQIRYVQGSEIMEGSGVSCV
jgi:hypothetical protein